MLTIHRYLQTVLYVMVFSVLAVAQTSSDIRKKFGAPLEVKNSGTPTEFEVYELRPKLSMFVKYAEDKQVCEVSIIDHSEPPPVFQVALPDPPKTTPQLSISTVMDEIIPVPQRGGRLNETGQTGDCLVSRVEDYEKLRVMRYAQSVACETRPSHSVRIVWKQRRCKGE